jgi:ABC-type transport system substrate-binding protein
LLKVLNPVVIFQPTPVVIGRAAPAIPLATPTRTASLTPTPPRTMTPMPERSSPTPTDTPAPTKPTVPQAADLVLFLGGEPFEHTGVLDAIEFSVPWADVSEEIFSGQEVLIAFEAQGQESALSADVLPDREKAKELMADAGYPDGFPVWLVYTVDDQPLESLAEVMSGYLGDTGFQIVELLGLPMEEADAFVATAVDAGRAVMWLHRR